MDTDPFAQTQARLRVQEWVSSTTPYALAAMFSGPREGEDPRRNLNYGRWAGAIKLAAAHDIPLLGSGHSGEKREMKREHAIVDARLCLRHRRTRFLDDRAPHTAANVANLLRVGRSLYGYPRISQELIDRPITLGICTDKWHEPRVLFLADAIQRWLAVNHHLSASTTPFRFVVVPAESGEYDQDPEWVRRFADDEPRKMQESQGFVRDWFNGMVTHAPTMLQRASDRTNRQSSEDSDPSLVPGLQQFITTF